jgi:hypothetical protein
MRGICDTCDQVSELFGAYGRNDLNCSDCYTAIETTLVLYQTCKEIERVGGDPGEVEAQLKDSVNGLMRRLRHTVKEASKATMVN